MHDTWLNVLGLTGLLTFAVLLVPAARRLNFPYTVLLAAVGCLLGVINYWLRDWPLLSPLGDFLRALQNIEITSEMVFFVFLPALVFEAALSIDFRRLLDDMAPILLLAVGGLLISTLIVGASLWWVSGVSLVVCLLLGAIVSATDPVAVVAIFKEVGAPKRLSVLVEGESLFNDATAIVAFSVLLALLTEANETGFAQGLWLFCKVFFGGVIVGAICGRLLCWLIELLGDLPLVDITLTIGLAYLVFIFAEHYLHLSGVMAVVAAALTIGSRGQTIISPRNWHQLHRTWEEIGFWANSIIFILVGMAVPGIMAEFGSNEFLWLGVMIVAAYGARALSIYGLLPGLSRAGLCQQVSGAYKTVMFWGGLRGAVSLALALAVMENNSVDPEVRQFIGMLVTGFVLFTLFVSAPSIRFVINGFGLDKLSSQECVLRDRAMGRSLTRIREQVKNLAQQHRVDDEICGQVVGPYRRREQQLSEQLNKEGQLDEDSWLAVGLSSLVIQERKFYDQRFGEGVLRPVIYRQLVSQTEDLGDAIKAGGEAGYHMDVERQLSFDDYFYVALVLHRKLGIKKPLAQRLAERFEVLSVVRLCLQTVLDNALEQLRPLLGESVTDKSAVVLRQRLADTERALGALSRQYSDYARDLDRHYLERNALEMEAQNYSRMFRDAVISGDVYADLQRQVDLRRRKLQRLPALDLGLTAGDLIAKVPLFSRLNEAQRRELSAELKPRLAIPGEQLISAGEVGEEMYFISSGAVEVCPSLRTRSSQDDRLSKKELPPDQEHFTVGNGSFFGEIALVTDTPRTADVVALVYCDLLVLSRQKFQHWLQAHPDLEQQIQATARERMEMLGSV